jgi:hypothetical protein
MACLLSDFGDTRIDCKCHKLNFACSGNFPQLLCFLQDEFDQVLNNEVIILQH